MKVFRLAMVGVRALTCCFCLSGCASLPAAALGAMAVSQREIHVPPPVGQPFGAEQSLRIGLDLTDRQYLVELADRLDQHSQNQLQISGHTNALTSQTCDRELLPARANAGGLCLKSSGLITNRFKLISVTTTQSLFTGQPPQSCLVNRLLCIGLPHQPKPSRSGIDKR